MRRLEKILIAVENWTVILSFITIVLVTFINVVTRYVVQTSLAFTEELTINLLVVLTMSGAVVAFRERAHLGFTYIVDHASGRGRQILVWVITAVVLAFLLVLVIYGGHMTLTQMERGRQTPSLQIPQWLFTVAIPLAGILGCYHTVRNALHQPKVNEDIVPPVAAGVTSFHAVDGNQGGENRG